MSRITKWRGKEVSEAVAQNVARALGEIGLRAEAHSKKVLRRGHGVLTGTLRRSIHLAQPGYNWSGDDVEPASGTPERGGQKVDAAVVGGRITLQLGSGLKYAAAVHQRLKPHGGFTGYHYLTIGVDKAKKEVPVVLKKYQLKRK